MRPALAQRGQHRPFSFAGNTLTAHPSRHLGLSRIIGRYLDRDKPWRVLEIGCGTGQLLLELSGRLPKATLVGVDISESNVATARSRCDQPDTCRRVEFVASDYMRFQGGKFDAIVSDQTLHLIDTCSSEALFSKIAADLRPPGLAIVCMPYACLYNHILWAVRWLGRCVRGRTTDGLMLALARLAYGRQFSDAFFVERIPYMYLSPKRRDNRALRRMIREVCGLEVVGENPVIQTSVIQPRHRVVVFRKRVSVSREGDHEYHDAT